MSVTASALKVTDLLEAAHFKPTQARAITDAVVQIVEEKTKENNETLHRTLMTKEDGAKLELKIEQLRTEMEQNKADIIKWVFLFWLGLIPVLILIVKYVR